MPDNNKEKKEKVTRLMNVTMDKDEFDKLDKGETHSANGIRNDKGKLSALPDISPVSYDDLPQKEVIQTETIYIQPEEPSYGEKLAQAGVDFVGEVLSDPEVQDTLVQLFKAFWHYKIVPKANEYIHRIKESHQTESANPKPSKMAKKDTRSKSNKSNVIAANTTDKTFVLSEAQAEALVSEMRSKLRELSELIYLLSNSCVKDETGQEKYIFNQSYLQQLASEESKAAMKSILQNKELLQIDEKTETSFSDFLNGYIHNGNELIKIPINN